MSNWRADIKKSFQDWIVEALGDEVQYVKAWNSQLTNHESEETRPHLGVFFEYSSIQQAEDYLKVLKARRIERFDVEVTLHIAFDYFSDEYQDLAYDYAYKLVNVIHGQKHPCISGQVHRVSEFEDTNHDSMIDHRLVFLMKVQEVAGIYEMETVQAEVEVNASIDVGLLVE